MADMEAEIYEAKVRVLASIGPQGVFEDASCARYQFLENLDGWQKAEMLLDAGFLKALRNFDGIVECWCLVDFCKKSSALVKTIAVFAFFPPEEGLFYYF